MRAYQKSINRSLVRSFYCSVARAACILPQRMNDLITGARRFTVETSFKIEKALNISDAGFFYLHQAEHDIYLYELEQQRQHLPNLSLLTKTTFWDVNLEEVNWGNGQRWAIRRVLEYGEPNEVHCCPINGHIFFVKLLNLFKLTIENVPRRF